MEEIKIYGYMRVSSREQNEDRKRKLQQQKNVGCQRPLLNETSKKLKRNSVVCSKFGNINWIIR